LKGNEINCLNLEGANAQHTGREKAAKQSGTDVSRFVLMLWLWIRSY